MDCDTYLSVKPQLLKKTVYFSNGQFQKISIHQDGCLFGIPRARQGFLNWNSEVKGRFFELEF